MRPRDREERYARCGKLNQTGSLEYNGLTGEPDALKGASPVCAVRRVVVSLLEAGGTEERFLSYWHIWRRKLKETKHAREAKHV